MLSLLIAVTLGLSAQGASQEQRKPGVEANQLKVIRLLLEAGGDKSIRDDEGNTPLALARKAGAKAAAKALAG